MKHQANIESIEKALQDLLKTVEAKNLDLEILISQASRLHTSKEEREIIKYSTSSAIKRKFFMHVYEEQGEEQCIDCIPTSA